MQDTVSRLYLGEGHPSRLDAASLAHSLQTVTEAGLQVKELLEKDDSIPGRREDGPPPSDAALRHADGISDPAFRTVVAHMRLRSFKRQLRKVTMKAFVPPAAYEMILRDHGRAREAALPFAEDRAWLYRARWLLDLPHLCAHESIRRCALRASIPPPPPPVLP